MADYIEAAPGLIVDTDGEIVSAAGIDDPLKFIVARRDEARRQMKRWEELTADLDRVILRKQGDKTVAYGNVIATIRGGTYAKTDVRRFALESLLRLSDGLDFEHPEATDAIQAVIAAASGFKRDLLPESVRHLYDEATATLEKRPWVETAIARELAPARVITHPTDDAE